MSLRVIEGGKEPVDVKVRRLFFAVSLPPQTQERALKLVLSFNIPENQVRWVRRENLHITLKFLGDVETEKIPAICDAARLVTGRFSPIAMKLAGLGVFPNHERPRVVWIGAEGEIEILASLEAALSQALEPLGFAADERRYTPHITIGRVKNDMARGKISRIIRDGLHTQIGDASVESISLYESSLKQGGPVYSVIETFPLGKEG